MRDSFVFYRSYREAMNHMSDEEQLAFCRAVFDYAFDDEDIDPDAPDKTQMAFLLVKPYLDSSAERYDVSRKRSESGRLGGRPRHDLPPENQTEKQNEKQNKKQNEKQTEKQIVKQNEKQTEKQNKNPNVNVNLHVNENVNFNEKFNENFNDNLQSLTEKEGEIKESEEKGFSGGFSQKDYTDFMAEFDIRADSYNADLGSIDFRRVAEAYRVSPFLRTDEQAHWLSWVCRHYEKIVAGYYCGRVPRQKSGEMVQDTLRELKRRAVEEDADGETEDF